MNDVVPQYPWTEGDHLFASALNAAIANAPNIMTEANVLAFGADPTGATDSAAAINAAAAYATAHLLQNVYCPAGKYYIRSAITLGQGTTLLGDGRENTVIQAGGDFDPAATGVIILTGRERASSGVRRMNIDMIAPLDQTTTAFVAAIAGATTITLASATNVNINDYVWNTTHSTAIAPFTLVTNVAGNVVTVSPAVTGPGVSSGDAMAFSPSRARFKTLAAGGTAGFGGNSGIMYPPVINANGSNRFEIEDVWITGAWDGIVQNSAVTANGGGYLHNVSISAFNTGLDFDNLRDFLQISDFRFGGFTISNVHAGQGGGVFMDGATIGAKFGRIDGMAMTNSVVWQGKLWWTTNAAQSQDPHVISAMVIDGGTIQVDGGSTLTLVFSSLTMVGSGFGKSQTVPLITVSNGRVNLSGGSFITQTNTTTSTIVITGGSLNVGGTAYLANDAPTQGIVVVSGGQFAMTGGGLVNHTASNTSVALVQQSGAGSVVLKSVAFGGGSGTPLGVNFATDVAANNISGLSLGSYTVSWPANPTLGSYGQSTKLGSSTAIGGQQIALNSAAANFRSYVWQTGGLNRWAIQTDNTAEGGSNAGSNLVINRFSDAGAALGQMLAINRASGAISFLLLPATTTYANDAAAAAGGVIVGQLYRNGSVVQVRVV